jgi:hypothetical protein
MKHESASTTVRAPDIAARRARRAQRRHQLGASVERDRIADANAVA